MSDPVSAILLGGAWVGAMVYFVIWPRIRRKK